MTFKKAIKKKMNGRLALCGPTGSGKTYSLLAIGTGMLPPGGTMAVIDSERRSASKYANLFDFDVMELDSQSPDAYIAAIESAAAAGYNVLGIDSLSHAWMGKDGALEQVDKIAKRMQSANAFAAWRDVTPMHNRLVEAILNYPGHIIVTMRSKMDYIMEKDSTGTKTSVKKVGMAPVQRDGMEYEFDVVGDTDFDNELVITKSRCPKFKGLIQKEPGAAFGKAFLEWLDAGKDPVVYATEQAAKCNSVDDLAKLKAELHENGQFTEETKAILAARYAQVNKTFAQELDAAEVRMDQRPAANGTPAHAPAAVQVQTEPASAVAVAEAPDMGNHKAPLHVQKWVLAMDKCETVLDFLDLESEYSKSPEINRVKAYRDLITKKGAALGIDGYTV